MRGFYDQIALHKSVEGPSECALYWRFAVASIGLLLVFIFDVCAYVTGRDYLFVLSACYAELAKRAAINLLHLDKQFRAKSLKGEIACFNSDLSFQKWDMHKALKSYVQVTKA